MTKDHRADPDKEWEPVYCMDCDREVRRVYDKSKPAGKRVYWRHVRKR